MTANWCSASPQFLIGINATADCTLTLRRKRGADEAIISVTGRDVEDFIYTIKWDKNNCTWEITGNEELRPYISESQQEIIDFLYLEKRDVTTAEIIKKTGKTKQSINNTLKRLNDNGFIKKTKLGHWRSREEYTSKQAPSKNLQVYLPENQKSILEELNKNENENQFSDLNNEDVL
jgi:predicted transcriptional regulator